ncbi:MAG: OsmC family protein [Polyangiales bacterium]
MSEHRAIVRWSLSGEDFRKGRYSRAHSWSFDGGLTVPASASPSVVRAPWSDPAGVDSEEAFVASIASCHMLTFLWLAGREGFEIVRYEDEAVGTMTKNNRQDGRRVPWVSTVTLSPLVEWREGFAPTAEREEALHHQAHDECFISNSVKTEIVVAPRSLTMRA